MENKHQVTVTTLAAYPMDGQSPYFRRTFALSLFVFRAAGLNMENQDFLATLKIMLIHKPPIPDRAKTTSRIFA